MHQDRRDDLRVFVADQLGHGVGVQPVQRVDAAAAVAGFQDVFDQAGRAVAAQRLGQHAADVVVRTQRDGHELVGFLAELFQDDGHVVAGDLL
ncbi:hypothetical protein D3C78_1596170 [compost metagenome]